MKIQDIKLVERGKSSPEWKFITLNAHIIKQGKSQINNNVMIISTENQKVFS